LERWQCKSGRGAIICFGTITEYFWRLIKSSDGNAGGDRSVAVIVSDRRMELMKRAADLEGVIWRSICDTREDNITVMLDALATIIKRVSEYSMKAEAEETAKQ
jgi:hypothetical protein